MRYNLYPQLNKPFGIYFDINFPLTKKNMTMKMIGICWSYYFTNLDKLVGKACEAKVY